MELAYQWDLVEEEASDAFERLGEAVTTQLEEVKELVEGRRDLFTSALPRIWLTSSTSCSGFFDCVVL